MELDTKNKENNSWHEPAIVPLLFFSTRDKVVIVTDPIAPCFQIPIKNGCSSNSLFFLTTKNFFEWRHCHWKDFQDLKVTHVQIFSPLSSGFDFKMFCPLLLLIKNSIKFWKESGHGEVLIWGGKQTRREQNQVLKKLRRRVKEMSKYSRI